jgi:N,N'-diacetyllegionaminate synthase
MNNRTIIIAEVGVNHNGSVDLAKQLIDEVVKSGADFVKFQTFKADSLVTKAAEKADYQKNSSGKTETQYEMLSKLELDEASHHELMRYCEFKKIKFMSTAFDNECVDFLFNLGQKIFKVPSGEITNLPYLRRIGKIADEVILSTGMSNLGEIEFAINVLEKSGLNRANIVVLHCTSEYPAPLDEVNLLAMKTIGSAFGVRYGYSDHTMGIEVSLAAVALGASVIEKHITLDKALPGPDHLASLEPHELMNLVNGIRNIELALGDGVKRVTASELKNRDLGRKSLVAKRHIFADELLTEENVTCKRPGTGLSSGYWDYLIGSKATREFEVDELFTLDGIKRA